MEYCFFVMKHNSIHHRRLSFIFSGILAAMLSSCGDYSSTTPYTAEQSTTRMKGYPAISGKPALRTPAAIGIFTTGRTDSLDFSKHQDDLMKGGNIRSMQSIHGFVSSGDYYQMSDILAQRAKLLNEVKFLGLDVLLICDQMTDADKSLSLSQIATLGIVDLGLEKQNTQLTVLCMDARTGYIYGTMGQQEDGRAPKLALFDSAVFGDPNRSYLVNTTRRDAVKKFPEFWQQVVTKYSK